MLPFAAFEMGPASFLLPLAGKRPDFGDHQSHRDERKFFATKLI
jgi:hypothetical protein